MTEKWAYTPKEACEALRIGRTKLYELLSTGELKAVALGRKTLIVRQELERFLEALPPIPLARDPASSHTALSLGPPNDSLVGSRSGLNEGTCANPHAMPRGPGNAFAATGLPHRRR